MLAANSPSASAKAAPAAPDAPPRADWAPPLVEFERPIVSSAVCPLQKVLKDAGKNAERLVNDLQEFTSSEDYQTTEIQHEEDLETSVSHSFSYTAVLEKTGKHSIRTDEFRDQHLSAQQMPDRLTDFGAPALFLLFHPYLQHDFSWTCEGLGVWRRTPAWVVRFEQLPGHPDPLLTFRNSSGVFPLPLRGRAWLSESDANVEHVEAELTTPISNAGLDREQFVVDYQPETLGNRNASFWLPLNVEVYYHYRGHYLHHFHHFSNFELFWRDDQSKSKLAKSSAAKSPSK